MLSKLDREGREGVVPARAISHTVGIPQVHFTGIPHFTVPKRDSPFGSRARRGSQVFFVELTYE